MPGQGRQGRTDAFQRKARREGYRARSAYKLMDIQKRSKIFRKGSIVLDLGAAPGGWSQVALEFMEEEGKLVGVDLQHILPCLLYTSPSPRDRSLSRMPSSA